MKQITCPHCGDAYPDFDVAHVCSKGPYAPKLKPMMNERIKLLKHQASVWCDENIPEQFSEETNGYGSAWEEKFAEFIIAECANIAMREDHDASECIKEYFGISTKD